MSIKSSELLRYLSRVEIDFENKCSRCGRCCGSENDPCIHLKKVDGKNRYLCRIYDKRLGARQTVSGNKFACVPIKDHIRDRSLHPGCMYNK